MVEVIDRTLPSVVAIRVVERNEAEVRVHIGSGAILHEHGYVLTNAHVVRNAKGGELQLSDDRVLPFQTLVRWPCEDLAILRIPSVPSLKPATIGRSHDLMLGEPTVVIGSPTGLARSVSTGIVSGLSRATRTEYAFLPSMVQTTAATSGGSSGGPLLNALGQQIGVITSRDTSAQNISFAIMIDHVRQVFPNMVAAEQRIGFQFGAAVDMLAEEATVTEIRAGSPAEAAGLQVGDVVTHFDDLIVRQGIDFHLMTTRLRPDKSTNLRYRRGEETHETMVTPTGLEPLDAVGVENVQPGLEAEVYAGLWDKLPDFQTLESVERKVIPQVKLDEFPMFQDKFAMRATGFVKIPADGLYGFYLRSDDGSQLFIGDRQIVDNDGLHAAKDAGGLIRLKAGLHHFTVEFFEAGGSQDLRLMVESTDLPIQEMPADWLFHQSSSESTGEPK